MPTFLFRCPVNGMRVQGWVDEYPSEGQTFVSTTCQACQRVHLVNPKTGRVAGEKES